MFIKNPACFDNENILVVSGSNEEDKLDKNNYNYSSKYVDIYAPANNLKVILDDYIGTDDGTSYSAPMVTGAAALYLLINNNLTPIELKQKILDSSDKLEQYKETCVSNGRLNIFNLLHDKHYKSYKTSSYKKHKEYCNFCDYLQETPHIVSENEKVGNYYICLLCGGLAEIGFSVITSNLYQETEFINGVIYLSEEDYLLFKNNVISGEDIYEKVN